MFRIWYGFVVQGILLLQIGFADAHNGEGAEKKFGDPCKANEGCDFEGSVCDSDTLKCRCSAQYPVTNHIDKCGIGVSINESCTFNEQCEEFTDETECRDGTCICRFEKTPATGADGRIECIAVKYTIEEPGYTVDPTMIGILVAMIVMFIIICVVLRLFSKARFRENRTIFNTPNPRLMNASLLRDKKPERCDSKASIRGPSRQASQMSLRSPVLHEARKISGIESCGSSPSNRSAKGLHNAETDATLRHDSASP